MPTISECIFTISEVTYLSLQNNDVFTTLHLESIYTFFLIMHMQQTVGRIFNYSYRMSHRQ